MSRSEVVMLWCACAGVLGALLALGILVQLYVLLGAL